MAKIISFGHEPSGINKKLEKENLVKKYLAIFNSLDKFVKVQILTAVLIALVVPSIVVTNLILSTHAAIAPVIGTAVIQGPSNNLQGYKSLSIKVIPPTQNYSVDSEILNQLTLLNQYRVINGLAPLTPSVTLTNIAKWMSNDMAQNNRFSHTDSLGRDPFTRMSQMGYNYNTWRGENIAAGYATGLDSFNAFKASKDHNANMLGKQYTTVGIYRAYNPSSTYGWYWAQEFGGYIDAPAKYILAVASPTPVVSSFPSATINPTLTKAPTPTTIQSGGFPSAPTNLVAATKCSTNISQAYLTWGQVSGSDYYHLRYYYYPNNDTTQTPITRDYYPGNNNTGGYTKTNYTIGSAGDPTTTGLPAGLSVRWYVEAIQGTATGTRAVGTNFTPLNCATVSLTPIPTIACTPTSSCASRGYTCGTIFNGCSNVSCGSCSTGYTCSSSAGGTCIYNPTSPPNSVPFPSAPTSAVAGACSSGQSYLSWSPYVSGATGYHVRWYYYDASNVLHASDYYPTGETRQNYTITSLPSGFSIHWYVEAYQSSTTNVGSRIAGNVFTCP